MKSRRVLQIIVAVLSIATLVCLAVTAVMLTVAEHVDVTPRQVVDFATTFKSGLKSVADKYYLYDSVVPAVAFGAPALLLLIAVILLLVKGNGKDAKNIAGCVFALVGALVLTLFLMVFAKHLFDEELLVAAFCVSGGLLALFIIFVGCALGVRPKRIRITDVGDENSEEVEHSETEETAEEVETESQVETDEVAVENEQEEEFEFEQDFEEEPETHQKEQKTVEDDTPATQYVPHLGVTIQEVVERTYGKEDNELNKATIEKINKVRALYDAKAITEDEYIKLIRKYLEF